MNEPYMQTDIQTSYVLNMVRCRPTLSKQQRESSMQLGHAVDSSELILATALQRKESGTCI